MCSLPTKIYPLQLSIPGKFVLVTKSPSFEILSNAQVSDHCDHVTLSVMTLQMLIYSFPYLIINQYQAARGGFAC